MKSKSIIATFIITGLIASCSSKISKTSIVSVKQGSLEMKVDSVLNLMTLEEKVGQLNQYNGFWEITGPTPKEGQAAKKYDDLKRGLVGSMLNVKGVKDVKALQKIAVEQTRLGIPLIFGFDVIHGYKTISPIPLAEAASWDLEAIKKSAAIAAEEAAAVGLNWTFAPMVDISRDARWGRVMEGAGEDPYLGSKIAVARVQGFQGEDLSATNTILACAKHFAGYGFAESGRDYNTVDVSESVLQNTIFPPFKAAVDAGVRTFMNSFNELNGIPATGSSYLQREVLKGDWKFDGLMVSDWGSINEMIAHGFVVVGLFFASEIIFRRYQTCSISEMGGIRAQAPRLASMFILLVLASVSLPTTFNFIGEFTVLYSLYQVNIWFAVLGGTTIILGAYYMLKMYQHAMLGETNSKGFPDVTVNEGIAMVAIIGVLFFFGMYPKPIMDLITPSLEEILTQINRIN